MSKPLTVALISTARPDQPGSMRIYADMINKVLADRSDCICLTSIDLLSNAPTWKWLPSRLAYRLQLIWLTLTAKHRLSRTNADVYHLVDGSFAHILKGFRHQNITATVHDLIPVLQAKKQFPISPPGRIARWLINRNIKTLKEITALCTVSTCSKRDLQKYLNKPNSITTIPLTLRNSITSYLPSTIKPFAERTDHKNTRTILHIGNNGFYKNRTGVLDIFSRLSTYYPLQLIMAGPPPDGALTQRLQQLKISEKQVEFISYPDDETLANLYQQSSILLFPSYYEGFGWPPLEAMAFGCPVVCSNAGSLPEVVGNAALTASPEDYDGLAENCRTLLATPDRAEQLVRLGYQNIKRFSEAKMADNLVAFYEKVANH